MSRLALRRANLGRVRLIVIVLLLALSLYLFAGTISVLVSNDSPDERCQTDRSIPPALGSSPVIRGSWQLFPLGIVCTYQRAPGSPRVTVPPDFLPSGVLIGGMLAALAASAVHISGDRARKKR